MQEDLGSPAAAAAEPAAGVGAQAHPPQAGPVAAHVLLGEKPRWRRKITVAAVLAGLLAASAVSVGLYETGTNAETAARRPPAAASALTPEQVFQRNAAVASTLNRRARAVIDRDRTAWMADVDRRDPSFVKAQQRVFDNLEQLDLAYWDYEVFLDGYERPHLARKYGNAPIYLPPVVLRYAIKGYDTKAVAVPIVLTFVARGSDWQIASDSDVDDDLPAGGHAEPWDRREIVARKGKHVLVIADAADRDYVAELVELGDAAVKKVAETWPNRWRRRVVISAVRDERLIETHFRTELQSSEDVAAIAIPVLTEVTDWVNEPRSEPELAGTRVIINPRYFDPDDEFNAHLLTHEIAHVATMADTYEGAPTWLVEGAAEYTASRDQPALVAGGLPASIEKQVEAGSVHLPGYDFYQTDIPANYAVGELACRFIADRYGDAALRKLYLRLGRVEREVFALEEQEKAFQELFGLSTAQFERRLAIYLQGAG